MTCSFHHDTRQLLCGLQGASPTSSREVCDLWGECFSHCYGQQYFSCKDVPHMAVTRRPGRRKRRPKELDSRLDRVLKLPCQLPQRNIFSWEEESCLVWVRLCPWDYYGWVFGGQAAGLDAVITTSSTSVKGWLKMNVSVAKQSKKNMDNMTGLSE